MGVQGRTMTQSCRAKLEDDPKFHMAEIVLIETRQSVVQVPCAKNARTRNVTIQQLQLKARLERRAAWAAPKKKRCEKRKGDGKGGKNNMSAI
jgi:hypothetical protein